MGRKTLQDLIEPLNGAFDSMPVGVDPPLDQRAVPFGSYFPSGPRPIDADAVDVPVRGPFSGQHLFSFGWGGAAAVARSEPGMLPRIVKLLPSSIARDEGNNQR